MRVDYQGATGSYIVGGGKEEAISVISYQLSIISYQL